MSAQLSMEDIQHFSTNEGEDLWSLSFQQPVLLVFLRHFNCQFCRELMYELGKKREALEQAGSKLVLVHMSDQATSDKYFKRYKLTGVTNISDPDLALYQFFGLGKGNAQQLFGLNVWMRGFKVATTKNIWPGLYPQGDGFQMPGVFLLQEGQIKSSFIHRTAADKPEYFEMVKDCCKI